MSSISFSQGTLVPASWLNDVNATTYNTVPALQTNLVTNYAPLNSPALITPSLGAATAVSINGVTINSTVLSGTNTGDQLIFKNVASSGQPTLVADTTSDTLTINAGTGISITTNATTDTLTITNSTSPGLTLLATYVVTGGETNIDFLTTFSATYDSYLVQINSAKPASATSLMLRGAVSGAITTGTPYYLNTSASAAVTVAPVVQSTSFGCTSTIVFSCVNTTTALKSIYVNGVAESASLTFPATVNTYAYAFSSTLSGFRLLWGSGTTFTAGVVRVYGYSNT